MTTADLYGMSDAELQAFDLRRELAEWLQGWGWSWMLTVTTRDPVPMFRASSLIQSVHRVVVAGIREVSVELPHRIFLGAESHLSNMCHVHGLVMSGTLPEYSRALKVERWSLWNSLFKTFGRSEVANIRSRSAVAAYTTKYVTKELAEWDIW